MSQQAWMLEPVIHAKSYKDPADSAHKNEAAMEHSTEYTENGQPTDNGNAWLDLGAGTGAFGGFTFLAAGHLCPVCLIVTPILLALGLYRKWMSRSICSER